MKIKYSIILLTNVGGDYKLKKLESTWLIAIFNGVEATYDRRSLRSLTEQNEDAEDCDYLICKIDRSS